MSQVRENVFEKMDEELVFEREVREKAVAKLSSIMDNLISEESNCLRPYRQVGVSETEQDTNYKGELRWEDEEQTIPKMKPIYDYVDVSEDELDDWDKKNLAAVRRVIGLMETLAKKI